ncbi:MAG TPA: hypothetical protein VMP13_04815 [Acidimicrobiia bacterium]|nr:hypothetical protein [Acidimicrobiia bacterium]
MTKAEDRQPSERRRWLAVLLGTVMLLASYLMFIWSFVAASGNETTFAGGLFGIALGLVPAVFAVAAFVSMHPRTLAATLGATVIWLVITVPIAIGNIPTGLVAGYGAGGVIAFRLGEQHSRGSRVVAVLITVFYTMLLQRYLPTVGIFAAAPLPFLAVALADIYKERFGEPESP